MNTNAFTRRRFRAKCLLAGAASIAAAAASAEATTIQLLGGGPNDGMNLESTAVVDAVYCPPLSSSTQTLQGVTFTHVGNDSLGGYSNVVSSISGSPQYSSGSTTGIAGTLTDTDDSTDNANLVNLVGAGLDYTGTNETETFTGTGLTPGSTYILNILYDIYGHNSGNKDETLTINGVLDTNTTGGDDPVFISDSPTNYNVYDTQVTVTAAAYSVTQGQISVTETNISGNNAIFNAIVINQVPEPATLGLFAAAGGLLLRRRRVDRRAGGRWSPRLRDRMSIPAAWG